MKINGKGKFLFLLGILIIVGMGLFVLDSYKSANQKLSPQYNQVSSYQKENSSQKKKTYNPDISTWIMYTDPNFYFTFKYPEVLSELKKNPPNDFSSGSISVELCNQENKERCYGNNNIFIVDIKPNLKKLTLPNWIEENFSSPLTQCAIFQDLRGKQMNQRVSGYEAISQEYVLDYTTILNTCKNYVRELNFSQGKYKNLFVNVKDKIFVVYYINETYSYEENLAKVMSTFTFTEPTR